jgi:hypothetical protein
MKGSHLLWLSRSKGMTVDIWIRDYIPPRCFQKKISGRSKHNVMELEAYIGNNIACIVFSGKTWSWLF